VCASAAQKSAAGGRHDFHRTCAALLTTIIARDIDHFHHSTLKGTAFNGSTTRDVALHQIFRFFRERRFME
jgi:hypothetical protein